MCPWLRKASRAVQYRYASRVYFRVCTMPAGVRRRISKKASPRYRIKGKQADKREDRASLWAEGAAGEEEQGDGRTLCHPRVEGSVANGKP